MIRIGLTGGFGSGKSAVTEILRESDIPVIDSDEIARHIVRPGSEALSRLCDAFGADVLLPDGNLDRLRLAEQVFKDPSSLKRLNDIMHPMIYAEIEREIERYRRSGHGLVIIDAPLLIEEGLHEKMDKTIVVWTPPETCIARLVKYRGFSAEEARQRIAAQMSLEEKCKLADYTIDNSGTLAETQRQTEAIIKELRSAPDTTPF